MFSSKKIIQEYFRPLRDKYLNHLGEPITDPADISDLIQLAHFKFCSLAGFKYFTVMRNHYGTFGFRVFYQDGRYKTLGFTFTKPRRVVDALRYAISDDIWEMKLKHPNKEIHHVVRFSEIVSQFFNLHPESTIETKHLPFGGYRLSNPELEEEWVEFHRGHAIFQPLSYNDHKAQHKRSKND